MVQRDCFFGFADGGRAATSIAATVPDERFRGLTVLVTAPPRSARLSDATERTFGPVEEKQGRWPYTSSVLRVA